MDKVKSFALMLLFVSVALAVATFLLPSGQISKTAKAVMSVFMIFCVASPVFGVIGKNGDGRELLGIFSGFAAPDITENADVFAEEAAEKIKETLGLQIKKFTDISYNISVFADIGEDYVINIERVRISFDVRPDNLEEIAFALEKELGFMPDFEVTENG